MIFQDQDEKILENIEEKKPLAVIFKEYKMSKSYITLFNARDKAINRGVPIQYRLTDGGLEDYVEQHGFKKALIMVKSL